MSLASLRKEIEAIKAAMGLRVTPIKVVMWDVGAGEMATVEVRAGRPRARPRPKFPLAVYPIGG